MQALGSKLTRNNLVRWHDGIGVERILHARVPIIKFRHAATGAPCVMQRACNEHASCMLKPVSSLDVRVPELAVSAFCLYGI